MLLLRYRDCIQLRFVQLINKANYDGVCLFVCLSVCLFVSSFT